MLHDSQGDIDHQGLSEANVWQYDNDHNRQAVYTFTDNCFCLLQWLDDSTVSQGRCRVLEWVTLWCCRPGTSCGITTCSSRYNYISISLLSRHFRVGLYIEGQNVLVYFHYCYNSYRANSKKLIYNAEWFALCIDITAASVITLLVKYLQPLIVLCIFVHAIRLKWLLFIKVAVAGMHACVACVHAEVEG